MTRCTPEKFFLPTRMLSKRYTGASFSPFTVCMVMLPTGFAPRPKMTYAPLAEMTHTGSP